MASPAVDGVENVTDGRAASSDMDSLSDDDRSSSLSEIEDDSDQEELEGPDINDGTGLEVDSEAETERLENSPHTPSKNMAVPGAAVPFEKSPSKLAQATSIDDNRNDEGGKYSDSAISSPLASLEEPSNNGFEEAEGNSELSDSDVETSAGVPGKKRKRDSSEKTAEQADSTQRPLRKRTGSVKDGVHSAVASDPESGGEEPDPLDASRESTVEPVPFPGRDELNDDGDEDEIEEDRITRKATDTNGPLRPSKIPQLVEPAADDEEVEDVEEIGEIDAAEDPGTVSEDEPVGEEVDDAEAERRNDEESAKKLVAMESMMELEKQFAILRDKLYDERIAAINKELLQLAGPKPTNAQYLEQLQYVLQHRDEKYEYDHKLVAFKIQALKLRSVAERSQIHSAYYQTVRDIREHCLDQANESFYKIQRDRFKPDDNLVNYSIPFPEKRSQQITQQASYNKEVSILAGVAKYVGFPAAPEISVARQAEVDDDLEKMGLPSQPVRTTAGFSLVGKFSVSQPAAEEQFLEQTPWANPQHPAHNRLNRQDPQKSASALATPANQRTTLDANATNGSTSTIPENLSAQASSALNTPYGDHDIVQGSSSRIAGTGYRAASGDHLAGSTASKNSNSSPTETRKASLQQHHSDTKSKYAEDGPGRAITSPPSRLSLFSTPLRPESVPRATSQHDSTNRHQNSSPLTSLHSHTQAPGIAAGSGYGRFGAR